MRKERKHYTAEEKVPNWTQFFSLFPPIAGECKSNFANNCFRGALRYFFDACRTSRVTAFARDLHLIRSGISARFATVFFARFHHTGAGNVRTGLLLRCCHKSWLHPPG